MTYWTIEQKKKRTTIEQKKKRTSKVKKYNLLLENIKAVNLEKVSILHFNHSSFEYDI